MKIGTKVTVTDACIRIYRKHLLENHMKPSASAITLEDLPEAALWAGADLSRPVGEVVEGKPAYPETTVKVVLSNAFGTYTHYIEKEYLRRRRSK